MAGIAQKLVQQSGEKENAGASGMKGSAEEERNQRGGVGTAHRCVDVLLRRHVSEIGCA